MRNHLLVGGAVKQRRRQHVHGVEPAAGLTGILDDKVRLVVRIKPLAVLKRIVLLRKRHRTRLEPAVQHLRHATHCGLSSGIIRVRAGQLVNVRAVQGCWSHTKVAFQLVQGAVHINARILLRIRHPDRDRRTPVAVPGDVPVARTFQPLAELPVTDMRGHPFDLLVQLHHAVAELGHRNKPRRQRHVDQRLAGTPGMRVGVLDRLVTQYPTLLLEVTDDVLISIKHQLPLIVRHQRSKLSVHVHRDHHIDAVLLAGDHIVLTKGRGLMDNTGAIFGGHVVRVQNFKGVWLVAEIIKDRLVGQALQLRTGVCGQHLVVIEIATDQVLRQKVALIAHLDVCINGVWMHSQSQVGWERPGRRRPRESVRAFKFAGGDRHGYRQRRILAHLVGVIQPGFLV